MSNSRIDEIIDRSQTNRKSKEQRDIGAIAWRERKQRLESAFAALHDSFPGNGARLARKGQTDGQVAGEYADCIIALGRQLERDKEILARPVYQLASNGDDAKAVAIEILKVGAIGNKRKVVGLLRKLTRSVIKSPRRFTTGCAIA